MRMAGLQNGRGSNNKIAMRPSNPPKTSKGRVKPNIAADKITRILDYLSCTSAVSRDALANQKCRRDREAGARGPTHSVAFKFLHRACISLD